jgi:hypothetical protein
MATRYTLDPLSAVPIGSAFPGNGRTQDRPYLAFDAATDQACAWTFVAPQGITGTLTAILHLIMASATTSSTYWQAQVEAVTPGDATDLDAGTSFDTANSGNAAVPATAGYLHTVSITLTNADSIAAGDLVRLRLNRDADNASDGAAGNALLLACEFRDGA